MSLASRLLICMCCGILAAAAASAEDAPVTMNPPAAVPAKAEVKPAAAIVAIDAKDESAKTTQAPVQAKPAIDEESVERYVGPPYESEAGTAKPAPVAPEKQPAIMQAFSNACAAPESRKVEVPKTTRGLSEQVGRFFLTERRGDFLFASDLPKKEFEYLVDGIFACCYSCLRHDYFPERLDSTVTIYVFRNAASYRKGLEKFFHMNPVSPYGHYGHSQRYVVVNYDTGPGTLVHEITHALMAKDFADAPIWISEGMASLYEQCRVEGNSLRGEANWRLPQLQEAIRKETVPPLKTLFAMSVREFRKENESLHYAASRYFCKFLEEKKLLRKVYTLFRDTHEIDPTGLFAVQKTFGKQIDAIETEWKAWVLKETWSDPRLTKAE